MNEDKDMKAKTMEFDKKTTKQITQRKNEVEKETTLTKMRRRERRESRGEKERKTTRDIAKQFKRTCFGGCGDGRRLVGTGTPVS